MADVLISLDDKSERTLRQLAKELYGGKKGSLSETVIEAVARLEETVQHRKRKASLERLIRTMEKGYPMPKNYEPYRKRSELYESRLKSID